MCGAYPTAAASLYADTILAAGLFEGGYDLVREFAGDKNFDFPTDQGAIALQLVARQEAAHQFAVIAHFDDAQRRNVAPNEIRRDVGSFDRRS